MDELGRQREDLERKYQELLKKYDDLRILLAQMGITVPDDDQRSKRPHLTIIKGGLAAIVGLLAWLLSRARRHTAASIASGSLAASAVALGVFVATSSTPPVAPRPTLTTPSPRAVSRNTPSPRTHRQRPPRRHTRRRGGVVGVNSKATVPATVTTLPSVLPPLPKPSLTPLPLPSPSPTPLPVPVPTRTSHRSHHCIVYVIILGKRVCVRAGDG
jgi:hypothetical protein